MPIIRLFRDHILYILILTLLTCAGCAVPVYTYQSDPYRVYQYPVVTYEYVPSVIYSRHYTYPSYWYYYPYYWHYTPIYLDVRIKDKRYYSKPPRRDSRHYPGHRKR